MTWETGVRCQVESFQRLKNMMLDISLVNAPHYMVRIKGKVEQYKERSSALSYISIAIEKGGFKSPSITIANFTIYIYIYSKVFSNIYIAIYSKDFHIYIYIYIYIYIHFFMKKQKPVTVG